MLEFSVEYHEDDRTFFTQGIMSSGDIAVSQSIRGDWLFLAYKGRRYSVSVEKLAVAWLEAINEESALLGQEPTI